MIFFYILVIIQRLASVNSLQSTQIDSPPDTSVQISLFEYLYNHQEELTLRIDSDIKKIFRQSSKEEYHPATVSIQWKENNLELHGRLRSRGNIRKSVCQIPPLKFDASKAELDSLGFLKVDKLKFVLPCKDTDFNKEKLYKELFLYDVFQLIEPHGLRAFLCSITLTNGQKEMHQFEGIVIEDDEAYAARMNAKLIGAGVIREESLDRMSFVKMIFFQYMIANTDWVIRTRHNIFLTKLPQVDRLTAIPYDFDFSGFVGQTYALPHESLPIKTVQQRYFFDYDLSDQEYADVCSFYQSLEEDVYSLCQGTEYLSSEVKRESKRFFKQFFDIVRSPDQNRRLFIK